MNSIDRAYISGLIKAANDFPLDLGSLGKLDLAGKTLADTSTEVDPIERLLADGGVGPDVASEAAKNRPPSWLSNFKGAPASPQTPHLPIPVDDGSLSDYTKPNASHTDNEFINPIADSQNAFDHLDSVNKYNQKGAIGKGIHKLFGIDPGGRGMQVGKPGEMPLGQAALAALGIDAAGHAAGGVGSLAGSAAGKLSTIGHNVQLKNPAQYALQLKERQLKNTPVDGLYDKLMSSINSHPYWWGGGALAGAGLGGLSHYMNKHKNEENDEPGGDPQLV